MLSSMQHQLQDIIRQTQRNLNIQKLYSNTGLSPQKRGRTGLLGRSSVDSPIRARSRFRSSSRGIGARITDIDARIDDFDDEDSEAGARAKTAKHAKPEQSREQQSVLGAVPGNDDEAMRVALQLTAAFETLQERVETRMEEMYKDVLVCQDKVRKEQDEAMHDSRQQVDELRAEIMQHVNSALGDAEERLVARVDAVLDANGERSLQLRKALQLEITNASIEARERVDRLGEMVHGMRDEVKHNSGALDALRKTTDQLVVMTQASAQHVRMEQFEALDQLAKDLSHDVRGLHEQLHALRHSHDELVTVHTDSAEQMEMVQRDWEERHLVAQEAVVDLQALMGDLLAGEETAAETRKLELEAQDSAIRKFVEAYVGEHSVSRQELALVSKAQDAVTAQCHDVVDETEALRAEVAKLQQSQAGLAADSSKSYARSAEVAKQAADIAGLESDLNAQQNALARLESVCSSLQASVDESTQQVEAVATNALSSEQGAQDVLEQLHTVDQRVDSIGEDNQRLLQRISALESELAKLRSQAITSTPKRRPFVSTSQASPLASPSTARRLSPSQPLPPVEKRRGRGKGKSSLHVEPTTLQTGATSESEQSVTPTFCASLSSLSPSASERAQGTSMEIDDDDVEEEEEEVVVQEEVVEEAAQEKPTQVQEQTQPESPQQPPQSPQQPPPQSPQQPPPQKHTDDDLFPEEDDDDWLDLSDESDEEMSKAKQLLDRQQP